MVREMRYFNLARKRMFGGVSLFEIITITVLAFILVAVLSPVFGRSNEKGREGICRSNMRHISVAIMQYLEDWNGCYPDQTSVNYPPNCNLVTAGYNKYTGQYNNSMGGAWMSWFGARYRYRNAENKFMPAGLALPLGPYIKNLSVFKCPSQDKDQSRYCTYDEGSSYYYKLALCYYANRMCHPAKRSEVVYPDRCSILYEEGWHGDIRPYLWDPAYWNTAPQKPPIIVDCIFMDGHIGSIAIPYNNISGHDGNWYYYNSQSNSKEEVGHYWNISANTFIGYGGARDVF